MGPLSAVSQLLQEKTEKTQPIKTVESSPKIYRNNIAAARNMFEKDNNETNEQRNKQVEFIKKAAEELINENEGSENIIQNGNKSGNVSPPKPLPRRTNSLSESEDVPVQKPVARPRTNSIIATTAPLTISAAATVTTTSPPSQSPTINVTTAYKVIGMFMFCVVLIHFMCVLHLHLYFIFTIYLYDFSIRKFYILFMNVFSNCFIFLFVDIA